MDGWKDRKKWMKKIDGYKKYRWIKKWTIGWITNGWLDGWIEKIDEWLEGRITNMKIKQMDGWMDTNRDSGWIEKRYMKKQMDCWMDKKQIDGWMDG